MPIELSREEIRAVYRQGEDAVVALVEMLVARYNELEQRVVLLEARLAKDSHNSSKPPSSDMFRRPPRSLRKKSKKRSGGRQGHDGHSLKQVDDPDEIVGHRTGGLCSCGRSLDKAGVVGHERRDVTNSLRQHCASIGNATRRSSMPASAPTPLPAQSELPGNEAEPNK